MSTDAVKNRARFTLAAIATFFFISTSSTARAEPLRLAVVVDHGALLPERYTFDALLQPGIDLGRLRLAATAGVGLRNPGWSPIVGFRPSVTLWAPATPATGLRIVGDYSYLTEGSWRVMGGLAIDLEAIHLGALAGYDSYHAGGVFLTTLAFDVPTIVRFLASAPFESAPDCNDECSKK